MAHEWVSSGFCIGFNTDRGLMLDLYNMKFRKALKITEDLCKLHKLECYLLIKPSPKNHHAVFNRYLSWRKITNILFSRLECHRWAVFQVMEGQLTLRISKKNGKDKPKIVRQMGKSDKLIRDYLEVYKQFKNY